MLSRKLEVPMCTCSLERAKDSERDVVLGDTCKVVIARDIRIDVKGVRV